MSYNEVDAERTFKHQTAMERDSYHRADERSLIPLPLRTDLPAEPQPVDLPAEPRK